MTLPSPPVVDDGRQGLSPGVPPQAGSGHSRAEPEEVSALRASVPNARRCSKHEPKSHGDTLQRLRGDVICAKCGREGMYSRGNRKWGRPPRVIWFR
jgi:hypothetical protein